MSRRKLALPPSHKPWGVGILAIDTARNSGWAVYCDGKYIRSGETKIDDHGVLAALVSQAMGDACDHATFAVTVLVLERPWGGSAHQIEGLGAARQAWMSAWRSMGQSKSRVVKVYPVTWRSKVLGISRGASLPLFEKEHARREKRLIDCGPDEAAAIGIGKWASHAGEIGAVLPKKIRESMREAV